MQAFGSRYLAGRTAQQPAGDGGLPDAVLVPGQQPHLPSAEGGSTAPSALSNGFHNALSSVPNPVSGTVCLSNQRNRACATLVAPIATVHRSSSDVLPTRWSAAVAVMLGMALGHFDQQENPERYRRRIAGRLSGFIESVQVCPPAGGPVGRFCSRGKTLNVAPVAHAAQKDSASRVDECRDLVGQIIAARTLGTASGELDLLELPTAVLAQSELERDVRRR